MKRIYNALGLLFIGRSDWRKLSWRFQHKALNTSSWGDAFVFSLSTLLVELKFCPLRGCFY